MIGLLPTISDSYSIGIFLEILKPFILMRESCGSGFAIEPWIGARV